MAKCPLATSIQLRVSMSDKEELISRIRKYDYSDIREVTLPHHSRGGNRQKVQMFARELDNQLSARQDSDVILIALTVRQNR
jgi:hypothetical protein